MLRSLTIKNIALIDCAEIEFDKGLNVLSGETGSGKSVILESLNFVLGAKADKSLIRNGEEECFVQAEFNIENSFVKEVLKEFDIEDDDTLILSRKYNSDGKNTIKVNGNTLSVSMLKKITQGLVDVHGQSEHFLLLNKSNQLELIDKFGGADTLKIKDELKSVYSEYKAILSEIDKLGGDESKRLVKIDILNYQIKEIQDASISEGEEEDLIEKKKKLQNQEKIVNALSFLKEGVYGESGADTCLSEARRYLVGISDLSEEYSSLNERLDNAITELKDIADTAEGYLDGFEDDGVNFDFIENRLELIKTLHRKYGEDYKSIQRFLENAIEEKNKLENFNEIAEKLLKEKEDKEKKLYNLYLKLNDKRVKSAKEFSENVKSELTELGMEKAKFTVNFNDKPDFADCKFNSANGFDDIEFFFSANAGEPVKPLSEIISGGEMSRFMLSVKAQTSKYNDISTFVFDEIDAGISGKTAKIVAEKFAKISLNTQIIAITHLPQISAMADHNLLIEKSESNGITLTHVKPLDKTQKISEIVRLVGGAENSNSANELAKEIINSANEYKLKLNN